MQRLLALIIFISLSFASHAESKILFNFENTIGSKTQQNDSIIKRLKIKNNHVLEIHTQASKKWPGVTLKPRQNIWDLKNKRFIKADIHNLGNSELQVYMRIDSSEQKQTESIRIAAKSNATLVFDLTQTPWIMTERIKLIGLFKHPQKAQLLLNSITSISLFLNQPKIAHHFTIDNIRAEGKTTTLDSNSFFPFIDSYGQFIHSDWPGKIHSQEDLKQNIHFEKKDLLDKPAPSHWNQYGGWTKGPQLNASGYFRAEKIQDNWWLVDPNGRLFWSNGISCITDTSATAISHREEYFSNLPQKKESGNQFYKKNWWATRGYYQDKTPYNTFNFLGSNLRQKYGNNWQSINNQKVHQRLRSWGINTLGNWSSQEVIKLRQTAYTVPVTLSTTALKASSGYWRKFHDVFNENFRKDIQKALLKHQYSFNDPWCLGIFVDNELPWGEELTLAKATIKCPAEQPAKIKLTNDLKAHYSSIGKLNDAWDSHYQSWDHFQESTDLPLDLESNKDLSLFAQKIAETYFRTIKEEIKKLAPKTLYLGCRFAEVNNCAARAAAKFCDIVSYNKYTKSVPEYFLPNGIDRPIMIGEFHFGAQDRGVFNSGLQQAANQQQRAESYQQYMDSALANPQIVGAHWFQYCDQPTSGRVDGENYQIGFISIADSPYTEIVNSSRNFSEKLYESRCNKKLK
jgi:hypothetical protein